MAYLTKIFNEKKDKVGELKVADSSAEKIGLKMLRLFETTEFESVVSNQLMRKEMEAIYLLVFKYNLLLSKKEIEEGQFKSITSQMQFQNRLAEEFIVRD